MRKLFIFLSFILLIISCSNEKYHPMDISKGSVVKEIEIYQNNGVDSYEKIIKSVGSSSHLLLGKYQDEYTSRILLKFINFPDSAIIKNAHIIMYAQDILGDTLSEPFEAKMYELTMDWEEGDTLLWNSIMPPLTDLISSAFINPIKDDSIVFELDANIVEKWMDTSQVNNGVWVDCGDASFIKDFQSREVTDNYKRPFLRLQYSTPGHQDTTYQREIISIDDTFIIEDFTDSKLDTSLIYIGRGIAFRSQLKFDLDSLFERKDTINKATLELTINENLSMFDASGVIWVQVSDSTFAISGTSPSVSENKVTIDVTDVVRYWYYREYSFPHYSFTLFSSGENSTIDRVAFYSSTAEPNSAPRLKIVHSIPPTNGIY